jgi:hypothetical protein
MEVVALADGDGNVIRNFANALNRCAIAR